MLNQMHETDLYRAFRIRESPFETIAFAMRQSGKDLEMMMIIMKSLVTRDHVASAREGKEEEEEEKEEEDEEEEGKKEEETREDSPLW